MAALNLKKIRFRNFRSYGDYDTELGLENLGPVLILGEIGTNPDKSNGAGKSSIADAIVWCLFGRLPYKQRPAGHMAHRGSGGNCVVELTTCDGYIITRTRNHKGGHNDLLIHHPNGQDISDSTNKSAQRHLDRLFDLDYDIFTSGIFFAQFGGTFLELPDQKRRKALERMLHQDRYDHYVAACKDQLESLSKSLSTHTAQLNSLDGEILRLTQQAQTNVEEKDGHEEKRKNRIEEQKDILCKIDAEYVDKETAVQEAIDNLGKEIASIKTFDIDKLQKEWDNHNKKIAKLDDAQYRIQRIITEVSILETKKETIKENRSEDIDSVTADIQKRIEDLRDVVSQIELVSVPKLKIEWMEYEKEAASLSDDENIAQQKVNKIRAQISVEDENVKKWEGLEGKVCPSCEQEIAPDHILSKCDAPGRRLELLIEQLVIAEQQSDKFPGLWVCLVKPEQTIREAKLIHEKYENKKDEIEQLEQSLETLEQRETDDIEKEVELTEEIERKNDFIKSKNKILIEKREKITPPKVTVNEAETVKSEYDTKTREVTFAKKTLTNMHDSREADKQRVRNTIEQIENEENPYDKIIKNIKKTLSETKKERTESNVKVVQYNKLIKHVDYIRSAYSDRRKIKAHILAKTIPYFNERIAYYLDTFECNFNLKFTNALQTKSELWPYEMWSGGERKKIDLALMFAIHDMHVSIYDQQCNILVFDEVDGRLDQDGVRKFTEILFNELATVDDNEQKRSILVMSHKDAMRDAFPTKILVRKDVATEEGCSRIEEVR